MSSLVLMLLLPAWMASAGQASSYSSSGDRLIVQTNKGPVRGMTLATDTGKFVDVFFGIPYAKPPVGNLRFRHPIPHEPWKEILDATIKPNSCHQIVDDFFGEFQGSTMWNANTNMSEDCLKMNIWVPKPRPTNSAVLVWVYGGGFYSGTSTLDVYDGRTLCAEEEIIVVSMNYRVASMGFLYFDHPDTPGNAGLFDQVLALQWIKDNIRAFGGNPHNVTLFGESAGAVSVSMHLLSPLSENLFSQAIMQSGTATAPWSVIDRKESIHRGLLLAEAVKCPHTLEELDNVIKCLREQNPQDLVNNEYGNLGVVEFPFVPVVDGTFMPAHPQELLETNNYKKAKILLGSNRDEGTFFIIYYLTDYFRREENVYLTREDFVQAVKYLNPYVGRIAQEAIIFQYTNWLNPDDSIKNRDAVDKIVGDYHFTCSVNEFAYIYALSGVDVYMYFFTHRSTVNPWPEWMGVIHGDEISFIFGEPLNNTYQYNKDEKHLSRRMMRYWSNFAKTGNPSLSQNGSWERIYWPVHTAYGKEYLTLAVNSSVVGHGHRAQYCAFWQEFLPQLVNLSNPNPTNPGCVSGASKHRLSLSMTVLAVLCMVLPQCQRRHRFT